MKELAITYTGVLEEKKVEAVSGMTTDKSPSQAGFCLQ